MDAVGIMLVKMIPIGGPIHTVNHCKPSFRPVEKVFCFGIKGCSSIGCVCALILAGTKTFVPKLWLLF